MRSTSQLRQVWHPPCQRRPPATFVFWTGVRVNVDGRVVEALRALNQVLKAWGYRPKDGETWGYNCRKITGGSGYSLHAYGIAVDINSRANPYGPRLITDMPRDMVAAVKAIRTKGGHRVWGWGGDYSRNKDAMHFEAVASPAELAQGIDWGTVAGQIQTTTVTRPPTDQEDLMFDTGSIPPKGARSAPTKEHPTGVRLDEHTICVDMPALLRDGKWVWLSVTPTGPPGHASDRDFEVYIEGDRMYGPGIVKGRGASRWAKELPAGAGMVLIKNRSPEPLGWSIAATKRP